MALTLKNDGDTMTDHTGVVAVVDDCIPFTNLIREVLAHEGLRVIAFHDAARAFDALVALQPDLIILDTWHNQPDAGWRLLQRLRLHPATIATPILVGSTNPTLLRARTAQFRQYQAESFEKPFELDDLLRKIRLALSYADPQCDAYHWPSVVRGGAYKHYDTLLSIHAR